MQRAWFIVVFVGCGATPAPQTPSNEKPAVAEPQPVTATQAERERVMLDTKKLAYEAFPSWAVSNPSEACPASLDALKELTDANVVDPWGTPYKLLCGATLPKDVKGVGIVSVGPDKRDGTADDLHSWDE